MPFFSRGYVSFRGGETFSHKGWGITKKKANPQKNPMGIISQSSKVLRKNPFCTSCGNIQYAFQNCRSNTPPKTITWNPKIGALRCFLLFQEEFSGSMFFCFFVFFRGCIFLLNIPPEETSCKKKRRVSESSRRAWHRLWHTWTTGSATTTTTSLSLAL